MVNAIYKNIEFCLRPTGPIPLPIQVGDLDEMPVIGQEGDTTSYGKYRRLCPKAADLAKSYDETPPTVETSGRLRSPPLLQSGTIETLDSEDAASFIDERRRGKQQERVNALTVQRLVTLSATPDVLPFVSMCSSDPAEQDVDQGEAVKLCVPHYRSKYQAIDGSRETIVCSVCRNPGLATLLSSNAPIPST